VRDAAVIEKTPEKFQRKVAGMGPSVTLTGCPLKVYPMKTIIQLSEAEEAKALPLLLRHSPGILLPNRIYMVSEEAAKTLREAGVQFTELSRESNAPCLEGVGSGERK
jgi:hypothetical protein